MAVVSNINDTLTRIVKAIEQLSEEEQKALLARLNAARIAKNPPKIVSKSLKISMEEIDRIKHLSRKNA